LGKSRFTHILEYSKKNVFELLLLTCCYETGLIFSLCVSV
jgi:hypothetical protein